MSDSNVVELPPEAKAAAAYRLMANAREEHIIEFLAWLRHAAPSRDDALLEIEVFAATARQLAAVNTPMPKP